MLILTIRTDKPEAEIGLFEDGERLAYTAWEAHRELAETIHSRLEELMKNNDKKLQDIESIIVYQGPGSFTGLRIGLSVANALAYSLNIPILATGNDNWIEKGIQRIKEGENDKLAMPEYGSLPNITEQRK